MTWNHNPDYVKRPFGPRRVQDEKADGFGCCIYCGCKSKPLTEEHVIPKGLAGKLAIREASCPDCQDITHAFEGRALHSHYLIPRLNLGFKKSTPQKITLRITQDNLTKTASVPAADYPNFGFFPVLMPPRLLSGFQLGIGSSPIVRIQTFEKIDPYYERTSSLPRRLEYDVLYSFTRMLAKIAYCYAIIAYGMDVFTPIITEYIRGKINPGVDFYVGGGEESTERDNGLHRLAVRCVQIGNGTAIVGVVRLFADVAAPIYHVCLGSATGVNMGDMPKRSRTQ